MVGSLAQMQSPDKMTWEVGVKERAEQECREEGDHKVLTWYRQLLQAVFRIGHLRIHFLPNALSPFPFPLPMWQSKWYLGFGFKNTDVSVFCILYICIFWATIEVGI